MFGKAGKRIKQAIQNGEHFEWILEKGYYYLLASGNWRKVAMRMTDRSALQLHGELVRLGVIRPNALNEAISNAKDEELDIS